jgi:hypothetical protein
MSGLILNQWRIFCVTENLFVYGYLPSTQTCSVCFNNNTHTINPNSISIVSTVTENTTVVSTQTPGSGNNGNYRCHRKQLIVAAGPNVISTQSTSYDYTVGILAFNMDITPSNIGDSFEIYIMPKTPIGVLTAAAAVGSTVISLPPSVIIYLQIGYQLSFTSSTTGLYEEESEIIAMNTTNNTVTLKTGVITGFNVGDYVGFLVCKFKTYYMAVSGTNTIGNYLRAAQFPTSTSVQIRYTNFSSNSKIFVYGCEYLF